VLQVRPTNHLYCDEVFLCDGQGNGLLVSDTGWITFGQEEDQSVPSYQPEEEQQQEQQTEQDEEDEESKMDDGTSEPPERPPAVQKTRDEIAMEQALAKYSAQLEKG